MKKILRVLFVTAILLPVLTISRVSAHDGDDHDGRGGDDDGHGKKGGGTSAPLDTGIVLLLAAGVGLGVAKVISANNASKQAHTDSAAK